LIAPTPACTPDVEFLLRHPDDPARAARIGHDPRRGGTYCELLVQGLPVTIDGVDTDPEQAPISEVVALLEHEGFLPPRSLEEIRIWVDTPTCWHSGRVPKTVRRVLRVIRALEEAAGE